MKQTIEWFSAKKEKPKTKEEVLISCKEKGEDFIFMGFYIPPHTIKSEDFWEFDYGNEENDYDEDEDQYYVTESWHAVNYFEPSSWRMDMNVDIVQWARIYKNK